MHMIINCVDLFLVVVPGVQQWHNVQYSSVGQRVLLQVCNLLMVKHSQRPKFSPFFQHVRWVGGWMHGLPHHLYKS